MSEKIEELYQEYLKEKLDLIFEIEFAPNPVSKRFDKKIKCNFINKKGELISETWFDEIMSFYKGVARVRENDKWNFINTKGELISNIWFDAVKNFHEGFACVKDNDKWNFINTKGELISDTWYYETGTFQEGVARVRENDKWNFINTKGELISDTWYYETGTFQEGFARVRENDKWNFINTKGGLVSKVGYWGVDDFHDGYAMIYEPSKDSFLELKHNFIDYKGNLLSNKWYDGAMDFDEGFALVEKNNKFNYINTKGKLISSIWYDSIVADDLQEKLAQTKQKNNTNLINKNREPIFKKIEMDDYDVKQTLFGYTCKNPVDNYKIKYMPIKRYGLRYTLCLNKDKVLLYDRINNQYTYEWEYSNILYDDKFIFDKKNEKVYFMYENQMIEITTYYNKHLKNVENIKINSGVTGIISKDEFSFLNRDKIDEIFKEIKEEKKKREELEKKEENERKLEKIKLEKERLEQEKRNAKIKAMENLKIAIQELSQFSDSSDELPKMIIEDKDIFVSVDGHFEISPKYLSVLKFIDLKYISFDNVKVDGIDFSGTNLILDPQKVYQKDLKKCNFEGVFISPFMNFRGVDIRGCHFSKDEDSTTYDTFNTTFKDAIYDETTTYNGISFEKILGEKNETKKNYK